MTNKKAYFNYTILDEYTAGIVLNGPEVKAIRDSKLSFNDSYCLINNGEIFVRSMHISIDGEPVRDRKLLLHKKEIERINKVVKEKGLTVVPLAVFVNETGLIKVKIGVAKGKKNYDKRESIKERDLKRVMND